jgi:hypothetical protein
LNEPHLRQVLAEWIAHYNAERPHSALGPGVPDKPTRQATPTGHLLTRDIESWRIHASAAYTTITVWNRAWPEFLRSTGVGHRDRDPDAAPHRVLVSAVGADAGGGGG